MRHIKADFGLFFFQSIRAQIEELNPSFNPDDFEIIRAEKERIAAKGSEGKGLDKRSKTVSNTLKASFWVVRLSNVGFVGG